MARRRRRPRGALAQVNLSRYDDGGEVDNDKSVDIDAASVDNPGLSIDSNSLGGFLGSPEMGGERASASNPNNSSGMTAALDAIANGSLWDGALDMVGGTRSLAFDPETGQFSPGGRDYAGVGAKAVGGALLGPLGTPVSVMMGLAEKYGQGMPGDYDRERGLANPRDNDHGDNGPEITPENSPASSTTAPTPQGPQLKRYIPLAGDYTKWGVSGHQRPGYREETVQLKNGGQPSGVITGLSPGRADAVAARLPPKSYIIPADVAAAEGDGNSVAGGLAIANRFSGGRAKSLPTVQGGSVPARISHGEVFLNEEDVIRAGGPDKLDRYVKETRRKFAKKLNNLPGPKK